MPKLIHIGQTDFSPTCSRKPLQNRMDDCFLADLPLNQPLSALGKVDSITIFQLVNGINTANNLA